MWISQWSYAINQLIFIKFKGFVQDNRIVGLNIAGSHTFILGRQYQVSHYNSQVSLNGIVSMRMIYPGLVF